MAEAANKVVSADEATNEVDTAVEAANMVCPNCHTFQPRTAVCYQCGVVVEKVLNANKGPVEKKVFATDDKPKTNILWFVLLLACAFYYFSKTGDDEEVQTVSLNTGAEPAPVEEEPEPIAIAPVSPDIALEVQRERVIAKLQTLKSTLYMFSVEGRQPPVNEEDLQSLVDEGLLTESDITDEWGNVFVYRLEWGKQVGPAREFQIFVHSKGPDGVSGNADDIAMP